jgi:hypothetical protein
MSLNFSVKALKGGKETGRLKTLEWLVENEKSVICGHKSIFSTLEFEKKMCLGSFKKCFGLKLGWLGGLLHMNVAMFKRKDVSRNSESLNSKNEAANVVSSGLQLMSASWLLSNLKKQLKENKSSPKVTLKTVIDEVGRFLKRKKCPIKGLRLTATGRLGKRKKGMSQQISYVTGSMPLNSLTAKIDYDQDCIHTRLGVIGLKVWLCYRSLPASYGSLPSLPRGPKE